MAKARIAKTYVFLKTLARGNHCACLVEAVGIENIRFRADSGNYV